VTEKTFDSEIEYKGNDELEDTELKETTAIKPYEISNMAKFVRPRINSKSSTRTKAISWRASTLRLSRLRIQTTSN